MSHNAICFVKKWCVKNADSCYYVTCTCQLASKALLSITLHTQSACVCVLDAHITSYQRQRDIINLVDRLLSVFMYDHSK